ncbi:MAG: PAS domain S-box protein [Dehalococcoidia bacterium]
MKLATKQAETENLFETLVNKAPVALYIVQGGKFSYANPIFQMITGYEEDELVGNVSLDLVIPQDREKVRENAIRMLKGKLNVPYQFRVIRKDGALRWVMESVVSIQYRGKRATLGYFVDITESKELEVALQAEKNKLQSLIDAMEDALTIVDRDYNIIFQNQPSKRGTGGDLTGEKCYLLLYEGQKGICEDCPVEKAFKDGKTHIAQRQRTIAGEVTFWDITANPVRDAQGNIVACLEIGRNITKRKRMEETLRDIQEKLQKIFDSVSDAICVIDLKGTIIEVNQRTVEMHGFTSKDELRGRKAMELIAPRDHERIAANMKKAIKQGTVTGIEYTLLRADGSEFVGELSTNVLKGVSGTPVGHVTITRDITERKKQDQALIDEATRRRILFEQSLDGIVVLDVDAKVVEANQRFADMLGYTLEEVQQLHTWDWDRNFPPEKLLEMGRNVDEKGVHLETKHTRKDGSVVDVDISINAATFNGQKLIFCICRDVTERKKMERALRTAAQQWRDTFDSITDAISIHDRDYRIQLANKAFTDLYNMELCQVVGKHCYELHRGDKPISGCPHQQTLVTKKPAMGEFYESHLGKYILESTSPVFDKEGEVIATIHVTRDVTAQKQQNERLMMADRLASLGELVAGTAHELNNPLTSILGFSHLLMEKELPDDIREDLKLINSEAQRAVSITQSLLAFARRHATTKHPTQINNVIEDVLKLRAYELKVNSIQVEKQLAPDLPEIIIDYFQMQQVFLNIINNAEYFMVEAHGRGTLTIATRRQNDNVVISIADDGPGIPEENLRRIFDPFFTTKPPGRGTGLGLSICHGIVTEHGGQIYAESQLGKGTTILVELPIKGRTRIRSIL